MSKHYTDQWVNAVDKADQNNTVRLHDYIVGQRTAAEIPAVRLTTSQYWMLKALVAEVKSLDEAMQRRSSEHTLISGDAIANACALARDIDLP